MKKTTAYVIFWLAVLGLLTPACAYSEDARLSRGFEQLRMEKYKAAVKIFSKSIKDNPESDQAYYGRGIARFYQKNYSKAISDFTKALVINPRLTDAFLSRGMSFYYKGQYKWALDDYHQALKEDPEHVKVMNQLAWTLSACPEESIRNGEQALVWAKKASALDTGPNYLDTLAAAYAATGDYKAAVETQKRVVSLLIENDREDQLPAYLERLQHYKEHKPWRDRPVKQTTEVAAAEPGAKKKAPETEKTLSVTSSETAAPSGAAPKEPSIDLSQRVSVEDESTYPYTIHVGVYPTRKEANAAALRQKNKGDFAFTSHAFIPGMGDRYRIFIGVFQTMEEAEEAALELKRRQFRQTRVVEKPYGIQVGAFNTEEGATKMESDLLARGFMAYRIPMGKNRTKLMIGAYTTKKVSVKIMRQLKGYGYAPMVVER